MISLKALLSPSFSLLQLSFSSQKFDTSQNSATRQRPCVGSRSSVEDVARPSKPQQHGRGHGLGALLFLFSSCTVSCSCSLALCGFGFEEDFHVHTKQNYTQQCLPDEARPPKACTWCPGIKLRNNLFSFLLPGADALIYEVNNKSIIDPF